MVARKSGGEAAGQMGMQASSLTPAGGSTSSSTPRDGHQKSAGEDAGSSELSLADTGTDANAGLKQVGNVSSPAPGATATPACPPAGNAAALSGIDDAPVAVKQRHQTEGSSDAYATTQGTSAPAAPDVGELQGCAQPAVARGDVERASAAEANPALVASEVGATPVGFSEGAVTEGETGAGLGGGGAREAPTHEVEASSLSSTGLILPSVGRDLIFEADLIERLGRLVCEGALIEVVDVHKEVSALNDHETLTC